MFTESLARDVRIGVRVLVKEKSFCAVAVFALAVGICTVTTQFSVVNGVMLRGFSFPNTERLYSVRFIDPTSATFFGVNGKVSSMDFEDVLAEHVAELHRLAVLVEEGRAGRHPGVQLLLDLDAGEGGRPLGIVLGARRPRQRGEHRQREGEQALHGRHHATRSPCAQARKACAVSHLIRGKAQPVHQPKWILPEFRGPISCK